MASIFQRIRDKATQAFQGVQSQVSSVLNNRFNSNTQQPSPQTTGISRASNYLNRTVIPNLRTAGTNIRYGIPQMARDTAKTIPFTPSNQQNFNQNVADIAGGNDTARAIGQGFNNWFAAPLTQVPYYLKQSTDTTKPFLNRVGDVANAGFGLLPGVDDIGWAGYNAAKTKASGGSLTEGLAGNEYTGLGSAVTGGKNTPLSSILNNAEIPLLLAAGGLKAINNPKNIANQAKNTNLPKSRLVESLQARIKNASKNAKYVEPPVPFSETTAGTLYKNKLIEASKKTLLDKGYNPELIKKITDEGYHPSTIKNILSKAKDQKKIFEDPNYAYNYYKKSAKAENLKKTINKPIVEVKQVDNLTEVPQSRNWNIPDNVGTNDSRDALDRLDQAIELSVKGGQEPPGFLKQMLESIGGFTKNEIDEIMSGNKSALKVFDESYKPKSAQTPEYLKPKQTPEYLEQKVNPQPVQATSKTPKEAFQETISTARSYDEAKPVIQDSINKLETFYKQQGKTIDDVAEDLIAGRKDKNTDMLTNYFETFAKNAEADGIEVPRNIKDYVTQFGLEQSKEILDRPFQEKSIGDMLTQPAFTKARTKGKTEPVTREALEAYAKESYVNRVSPEKQADKALANEVLDEIKKSKTDNIDGGVKIDIVNKVEKMQREANVLDSNNPQTPPKPKVEYSGGEKDIISRSTSSLFRGVDDRVAMVKDPKFYNDFLMPFNDVNLNTNKYRFELMDMSDESLKQLYGMNRPPASRADMISNLTLKEHMNLNVEAKNTFMENLKNADIKESWLKDLTNDIFDQYVTKDIKQAKLAEKVMAQVRGSSARATMGVNPASAINNVLETRRAFSVLSTKSSSNAIKRVISGEDLTAKYLGNEINAMNFQRMSDSKGAVGKAIEKVDKGLFYMFDKSEKLKDNILLAGLEEQGIAKGLKEKELDKYVLQKFSQYAIKYGKGQDIGLFRSPLMKTVFQYAQYPIKDLVIAIDKIPGVVKGDVGDRKYLAKYVISTTIQAAILKQLIGKIGFGDSTNTPLDFMQDLYDKKIPFSPIVQSIIGLSQQLNNEISGNELSDYDQLQLEKNTNRSLASSIIPASNQLMYKTGGAIKNQITGYQEKMNGSVANPVSSDPLNVGRSLLFGPSYDQKRIDYINQLKENEKTGLKGGAGLFKDQSNVFKSLPRNQQVAYYDKEVAKNKLEQANKNTINQIKEPKKEGRVKSALNALLGKEEEKQDITWGKIPTTPQEKKDHENLVQTALQADLPVPEKDIKQAIFDNKDPNSKSIQERTDVFSSLKSIMDNEYYTDEQKNTIAKASGIKPELFSYYVSAGKDVDVKLQEDILPKIENMDIDKMLQYLMEGRRAVAGKQLVTSTMVTYLYENDYINKDQKEMINALKFDEVNNKFYFSKSFKGTDKGSGSGMSYSKAKSLFNSPKITLKRLNSSMNNVTVTQPKIDDRLLTSILNAPKRQKNNNLWF